MILVSSWGGVGTTMLLEFLSGVCEVNPARGLVNPLKHALEPPHGAERAIFLFGCPATSLWSLFRRGYDSLHYLTVNGLLPELSFEGDPWAATCQRFGLREARPGIWVDSGGRYASDIGALEWLAERKAERQRFFLEVERRAREAYRDFDHFLSLEVDLFRRGEQLQAWRRGAAYPILLVRYERLWDNLPAVESFLGVSLEGFPARRPRSSSLDRLEKGRRLRLEALYGGLLDDQADLELVRGREWDVLDTISPT